MATHFSILAWRIPWTGEHGRLQSLGHRELDMTEHHLPITHEKTLHMDVTRWSTLKSDWLYSLQPKMEKLYEWVSEVIQSCPTLCDPMDCSLLGSYIHGIFQSRIMEWVAISFSGRSSQPRDGTWVSRIVGRRFTVWANRELCSFVEGYDILNIAIHPELQI